jgi:hypothetical protein
MSEVPMKILFSLILLCVFCSCSETVNPIPDPEPEPCEVPKYNQYSLQVRGPAILSISTNGKFLIYRNVTGIEDIKLLNIKNTISNEINKIHLDSHITSINDLMSLKILNCPYDSDKALFELHFNTKNNSNFETRYFLYSFSLNNFQDITPSNQLIINGRGISGIRKVWLSTSTPNNDFIHLEDRGVYKFQTWELIEQPDNSVSQRAISHSGVYKLVRKKTDTMITLKSIIITNSSQFNRDYQFSPDEKYFSFIEDIRFDTLKSFYICSKDAYLRRRKNCINRKGNIAQNNRFTERFMCISICELCNNA